MSAYWFFAAVAFVLSLVLNGWLIQVSHRRGWFLPEIRPRDWHQQPTPRVGGIGLCLGFLLTIGLVALSSAQSLNFSGQTYLGLDRNLFGLILAILLLGAVNIIDDYRGLSWPIKLACQISAALIIVAFGVLIPTLSNPFGGQIVLAGSAWLLVVVWLVVTSNVVNWLDGIDGLAGGVSTITLVVLFLLSISQAVAQPANAMLAVVGAGATLGFLVYNLRGKVFLGDTGSMFLGFLIGVIAIISGGKVATVFLVLAIPFLDALVVVVTRLVKGQSPFLADRRHLTHRLLDRGFKQWQIIALFYGISLIFGLVALNTQTLGKFWAILAAIGIMALFVLLYSFRRPIVGGKPHDFHGEVSRRV